MNLKAPLLIGFVTALQIPSTNVLAGGRQAGPSSGAGVGRAAPQRAAFRGSAPGFRGGVGGFRGSAGAAIRQTNCSRTGPNQFNTLSPRNGFNRTRFAADQSTFRNTTNWNRFNSGTRFNGGTTHVSTDWSTANRFRTGGFNRGG